MTLTELKKNVKVEPFSWPEHLFDITIKYKGKKYTGKSRNRDAWLAIVYKAKPNSAEAKVFGYTEKEAYETFYNVCKKQNKLK